MFEIEVVSIQWSACIGRRDWNTGLLDLTGLELLHIPVESRIYSSVLFLMKFNVAAIFVPFNNIQNVIKIFSEQKIMKHTELKTTTVTTLEVTFCMTTAHWQAHKEIFKLMIMNHKIFLGFSVIRTLVLRLWIFLWLYHFAHLNSNIISCLVHIGSMLAWPIFTQMFNFTNEK